MNTEARFLLAIGLMLAVIVGTNILFPPLEQTPQPGVSDTTAVSPGQQDQRGPGDPDLPPGGEGAGVDTADRGATGAPDIPAGVAGEEEPDAGPRRPEGAIPGAPVRAEERVTVEGPLFRHEFSSHGARLLSAELPRFRSLRSEGEVVNLLPSGTSGIFGRRLVVGNDTVDLGRLPFEVEPASGLTLEEGGATERLTFSYEHPTSPFAVEVVYSFDPASYQVGVEGAIRGVERGLVLTELSSGLAYNEADSAAEASMMAWVGNHIEEGVDAHEWGDVESRTVHEGPFVWAAAKSKFFVTALLPPTDAPADSYLGGIITEPTQQGPRMAVAQNLGTDGRWGHLLFLGPLDYARLQALGADLEEVNPYGWRFLRPVMRPIVAGILWVLNFLHDNLNLGYGWVLILFGVLMRVLLWPFNQKAMRAQMRNMQVQPMLKEIQEKYKDNPEKLQKEMMRLYKEYGFNPVAGCLPMLLPWPILIALFFVFQNTIELRGVEFLWLPDLSAKDPYYILPLFLALSMFALQFITYKSMDQDNPQMKMMMWLMPPFMGFIFMQFASGLNLYYATANIATIPQQFWIAKERQKAKEKGPVRIDDG